MVQNLQQFAFWNLIIRPPRAMYTKEVLGPADFIFEGGQGRRRDVEIQTSRGSHIACSHFLPVGRGMERVPVVIYLHGNTSNRLEAWDLVVPCLKRGISLFCFDAAGCGISEGEYISLGWHESLDLADVVSHLRKSAFCGPVALWGWSMGAATALLYADGDPSLAAMCLESPFASLRRLVEDLAQQGSQIAFKLPAWLIDPAITLIKKRVQDLADFDIDGVVPMESAKKARAPAIFISRKDDTFVQHHHTECLLENYGGDCEHVLLDGDHSCTRTADDIKHIVDFFCRAFIPHAIAAKLPSQTVEDRDHRIPEEHDQKHPTVNLCKPVSHDHWMDEPAAGEGIRSKPRCTSAAGIDFPEPRSLEVTARPCSLVPLQHPRPLRIAGSPLPALMLDKPLPPFAVEPDSPKPVGVAAKVVTHRD